jgi:serine/threonine protein kinase
MNQPYAVGDLIDKRFRVLSFLGAGGYGAVYKAEQIELGRVVAVKILPGAGLAGDARQRFEREARLLSSLRNSGIVQIHGFGIAEGRYPYMYMEYVEGETLKQLIEKNGALDWKRAVDIAIRICDALQAAHNAGIVHRDLGPLNVMVTTSDGSRQDAGAPLPSDKSNEQDTQQRSAGILPASAVHIESIKLLDFGLSGVLPDSQWDIQKLTRTGTVLGTVLYLSPEAVMGGKPDARSDIYSLGCLLYECIAGCPPFDGNNTVEVMQKQVSEEPISFAKLGKSTPPELERIVFQAMQKVPQHRFQSATDLSKALTLLKEGRLTELHLPPPAKAKSAKLVVPWAAIVLILLTGLMAGLFVLSVMQDHKGHHQAVNQPSSASPEDRDYLAAANRAYQFLKEAQESEAGGRYVHATACARSALSTMINRTIPKSCAQKQLELVKAIHKQNRGFDAEDLQVEGTLWYELCPTAFGLPSMESRDCLKHAVQCCANASKQLRADGRENWVDPLSVMVTWLQPHQCTRWAEGPLNEALEYAHSHHQAMQSCHIELLLSIVDYSSGSYDAFRQRVDRALPQMLTMLKGTYPDSVHRETWETTRLATKDSAALYEEHAKLDLARQEYQSLLQTCRTSGGTFWWEFDTLVSLAHNYEMNRQYSLAAATYRSALSKFHEIPHIDGIMSQTAQLEVRQQIDADVQRCDKLAGKQPVDSH